MGDFNAKIDADNTGYKEIIGKQGLAQINENGELFMDVCVIKQLVIVGSVPTTSVFIKPLGDPNHITENQINHVCASKRFRGTLQDVIKA